MLYFKMYFKDPISCNYFHSSKSTHPLHFTQLDTKERGFRYTNQQYVYVSPPPEYVPGRPQPAAAPVMYDRIENHSRATEMSNDFSSTAGHLKSANSYFHKSVSSEYQKSVNHAAAINYQQQHMNYQLEYQDQFNRGQSLFPEYFNRDIGTKIDMETPKFY